jgi:hypothetical protein
MRRAPTSRWCSAWCSGPGAALANGRSTRGSRGAASEHVVAPTPRPRKAHAAPAQAQPCPSGASRSRSLPHRADRQEHVRGGKPRAFVPVDERLTFRNMERVTGGHLEDVSLWRNCPPNDCWASRRPRSRMPPSASVDPDPSHGATRLLNRAFSPVRAGADRARPRGPAGRRAWAPRWPAVASSAPQ